MGEQGRKAPTPPSPWPGGVGGKGNAGVAASVQQIGRLHRLCRISPMPCRANLVYTDLINARWHTSRMAARLMEAFRSLWRPATPTSPRWRISISRSSPTSRALPELADHGRDLHAAAFGRLSPDEEQGGSPDSSTSPCMTAVRTTPSKLDYVPFPDSVVKQIEASWGHDPARTSPSEPRSIKSSLPDGRRIHPLAILAPAWRNAAGTAWRRRPTGVFLIYGRIPQGFSALYPRW